MNKKKLYFISSIVLFIIAGLLAAYSIWSFFYCMDIIMQAKISGQIAASGNEYDIVSFYMSNCAQYFVYALLLVSAGLLLQNKDNNSKTATDGVDTSVGLPTNDGSNDDLDEWFEENERDFPE